MVNSTSLFMMDEGKTDNKESVIDYMLSWTLRMANESANSENKSVTDYCQQILSKILFDDPLKIKNGYKSIESIKTWKQWKSIDLCAEVILIDKNNEESKHALLIENKAYSKLHHDQLKRYYETFEEEYKDTNFDRHYVYFTIRDEGVPIVDKLQCVEAKYHAFTMEEIRDSIWPTPADLKLTGNDIFDEFWVKNWG